MASHRSTAFAYRELETTRPDSLTRVFFTDWMPVIATVLLSIALLIMTYQIVV